VKPVSARCATSLNGKYVNTFRLRRFGHLLENLALSYRPLPPIDHPMPMNNSESGVLAIKEIAGRLKVTERTIHPEAK
jgi:hypothetical protein